MGTTAESLELRFRLYLFFFFTYILKKMTGLCKKEEYCALKTSLVYEKSPSLLMFSSLWDDLWLAHQRRDFDGRFSLRALIGQCQKGCPHDRIWGKTFFREQTGCRRSKIMSKINTNFVLIYENLFNLDEKVIWSFLALIAKNKLDEKELWALLAMGSHS